MISHLGLGSNVQLGLVYFKVLRSVNRDWFLLAKRILKFSQQDFKVCDWPLGQVSGGQSQTLKSTRPSWTL